MVYRSLCLCTPINCVRIWLPFMEMESDFRRFKRWRSMGFRSIRNFSMLSGAYKQYHLWTCIWKTTFLTIDFYLSKSNWNHSKSAHSNWPNPSFKFHVPSSNRCQQNLIKYNTKINVTKDYPNLTKLMPTLWRKSKCF